MSKFLKFTALLLVVLGYASMAYAQTTVTSTTTSVAVTTAARQVTLASVANVSVGGGLFMDREAMSITAVNTTSKVVSVVRGTDGSQVSSHASGVLVYVGPPASTSVPGPGPFWQADPPIGTCVSTSETYNLRINVANGRVWQCSGVAGSQVWLSAIDSFVFLPAGACNGSVSGNSTGTTGYTVIGTAPSLPVVNNGTSASGTNTHYFTCVIDPPSRTNATKAAYVVDVQFYYGVQTTTLGTQVATLASGTMSSALVFKYIDYPTSGTSETATGLTEATRADAGTLLITPVVGSFDIATTTAGEFYSATFTPASPLVVATDKRQLLFTISLLNTATSATITNSPGLIVHYRTLQAGF